MRYLQLNYFIFICICLTAFASSSSLQKNVETRTVKKELNDTATNEAIHPIGATNQSHSANLTIKSDVKSEIDNSISKAKFFQRNIDDVEIPESFKMGFYFFIGLSIAAILFIVLKIYRLRLSRAERKYGVHGDRTTQELTPLPIAIEDDSDNEDHTVFDINRQIRVS